MRMMLVSFCDIGISYRGLRVIQRVNGTVTFVMIQNVRDQSLKVWDVLAIRTWSLRIRAKGQTEIGRTRQVRTCFCFAIGRIP